MLACPISVCFPPWELWNIFGLDGAGGYAIMSYLSVPDELGKTLARKGFRAGIEAAVIANPFSTAAQ